MTQLSLIPAAPHASRTSGPASSHLAEARAAKSVRIGTERAKVLEALRRWPGSTGAELCALLGWHPLRAVNVRRHFDHLRKWRLAEVVCERKCREAGTQAQAWRPT